MPPCLFHRGLIWQQKKKIRNVFVNWLACWGARRYVGECCGYAQRVSEWEEELAASREGIMPGDESGPEQNHTDDGEQLHNTDATDDVKAVRVRKCLHVMGYCRRQAVLLN